MAQIKKNFKPKTQEDHHSHLHRESQPAKQNQKKKKKIPVLKNLHYINDSLWPTKERVQ